MSSKKCFKCGKELPLTEFYIHQAMGDGHLGKCKKCTRQDVRAHREKHIDQIRAYDRNRGNRQGYSYTKEYRQRFPTKARATALVTRAIRSGRIKPEPCFVCGQEAEAHHPDYDRPLDVVWLCPVHHRQIHGQFRRID